MRAWMLAAALAALLGCPALAQTGGATPGRPDATAAPLTAAGTATGAGPADGSSTTTEAYSQARTGDNSLDSSAPANTATMQGPGGPATTGAATSR